MNRTLARKEIRNRWKEIISSLTDAAKERVNGETSYICPFCGHGTHGDGLTRNPRSRDGNGLKCFNCGFSGDILDLYQNMMHMSHNEALEELAKKMGLEIDVSSKVGTLEEPEPQDSRIDYTEYYKRCASQLGSTAAMLYLQSRGITVETARQCNLGYDPEADIAQKGHAAPRIIIPLDSQNYIGRSIENGNPSFRTLQSPGGNPAIFNLKDLYTTEYNEVFVTEGAFDALSVIEVGFAAIALNSASNTELLIRQIRQKKPTATLVLCMDNDTAGDNAAKKLKKALAEMRVDCIIANIAGKYKDPNEALRNDRIAFLLAIKNARIETDATPGNVFNSMLCDIEESGHALPNNLHTGYANLDEKMKFIDTGIYIIAGQLRVGKTTFSLQMALQMAQSGQNVIYFSTEQNRKQITTKLVTMLIAQNKLSSGWTNEKVMNNIGDDFIRKIINQNRNVLENNFSIECDCDYASWPLIEDHIQRYINVKKATPIVFIDYLQLLKLPNSRKSTTREQVNELLSKIKYISFKYNLTIFLLSSVNRAAYMGGNGMENLKETGNIEFSANGILELTTQDFRKSPRTVDCTCLKNRYGNGAFKCSFNYYADRDFFIPLAPCRKM